jgi:hypothetical protein
MTSLARRSISSPYEADDMRMSPANWLVGNVHSRDARSAMLGWRGDERNLFGRARGCLGVQATCATGGIVGLFFILHLHDRNWVYVPAGTGNFRRVAVEGDMLSGGMQENKSGLDIGQQVVSNTLMLQNVADQQ